MRTRSTFASLVLLAVLTGTTACSGGEPQADPTPKMPPSSGTTPPSTTPTPEAWEVRSRAGVKAFLERYVELLSNALRDGDTAPFGALTTDCQGCNEVTTQIDDVYKAGGRIESDPLKFDGWSLSQSGVGDRVTATVKYTSPPTTWIRSEGARPEKYPGGSDEQGITLRWTGDGWTVTSVFGVGS